MKQTKMISDALENDEHLEHYGVMGMKWGVWNAETRARYSRAAKNGVKASGQVMLKGARAVHNASKRRVSQSRDKRTEKKRRSADRRKQRAELGMDPYKYAKLRKKTLKSHDPAVVARGMHTLTDEELGAKIRRLQQEDVISRMAATRETDRHRVRQARNQALSANPVYKFGESYVKKAGDRLLDELLPKKGGKGKKKSKGAESTSTTGKDAKGTKDTKDTKGTKDTSSSSANESGAKASSYEHARSYVYTAEDQHPSSYHVDRGRKYLESGSGASKLDDDIIDVDPINPWSDRR